MDNWMISINTVFTEYGDCFLKNKKLGSMCSYVFPEINVEKNPSLTLLLAISKRPAAATPFFSGDRASTHSHN